MPEIKEQGFDTFQIYVIVMGALAVLAGGWFLYNISQLRKYRELVDLSTEDLQAIWQMANTPRPQRPQMKVAPLQNPRSFFQRIMSGLASPPQVDVNPTQDLTSTNNQKYQEKTYTVSFSRITRRQLARFIFLVQQKVPFLKAKGLTLIRNENASPYETQPEAPVWQAKVIFGIRAVKLTP